MRLRVATLVAVLALVGCSSADPASERDAATTTSSSTTVAARPEWSRPCHPVVGPVHDDDLGSPTFGPLGAAPTVAVHLPLARQDPALESHYEADRFPTVSWARLRGATVVAAAPPDSSDASTSLLTVVQDDGSVRWTRCLDGTVTDVGAGEGGDFVVVATSDTALVLEAADGREHDRLDQVDEVYATSRTAALVGRTDPASQAPDHLVVVDLVTGARTELSPPSATDRRPVFAIDDDGTIRADAAVWRGAWVPDPHPPTVVAYDWATSDDPQQLVARAGTALRWELPLKNPTVEGRVVVQGDDVAVVWTCGEPVPGGRCPISLVGIDSATGHVRWTRPGEQHLGAGGNDAFLAREGDTWTMRSMADGRELAGQRWTDPETFLEGCCDEGRYRNVGRVGGTVVAVDGTDVRIWFPKEHSHPTVDVRP